MGSSSIGSARRSSPPARNNGEASPFRRVTRIGALVASGASPRLFCACIRWTDETVSFNRGETVTLTPLLQSPAPRVPSTEAMETYPTHEAYGRYTTPISRLRARRPPRPRRPVT